MPLRVTDHTQWCASTAGRRWARQDSGALIGRRSPAVATRGACDRRGRELWLAACPRLGYLARNITRERTNYLAPPPQTHVRKKLEPWRSTGNDPAAAFNLNGSRVGELKVFLDRAAALDRGPGKPGEVPGAMRPRLCPARLSPHRCLAGRPPPSLKRWRANVQAAKRN
jgi:hypothetical protein